MKQFVHLLFTIIIIISIFLCFKAFAELQWETLTASISLIIAVISAWLAFEVFAKQDEADQPLLVIDFDVTSRNGVLLLTIENCGTKPAFNINLHWENGFLDKDNNEPRFGNGNKDQPEILILNKGQKRPLLIDGVGEFLKRYDGCNMEYCGHVSYSTSFSSINKKSSPFFLSLDSHRRTISPETDQQNTYQKLATLPGKIDKLVSELAKIRAKIDQ